MKLKIKKLALLSLTFTPIMALPIVAASCSSPSNNDDNKNNPTSQSALLKEVQSWKANSEEINQRITEEYLPIIQKFQPTDKIENQSVLIQKANHYVLLKQFNEQLIKDLSKDNITQEELEALDEKAKNFDKQEEENRNNMYTMQDLYEYKYIEVKPEFEDQKQELIDYISRYITF
ncbi:hypothetical protein [Metamycoplasma neophronis]|uniref:Lipoprotein n=1 Tax=Metamycoplasma neophronis TaxID=872983 RepID=A0ABY2YZY1_9BACT|nr:hypothetical protein [Metamycoplasma neophronis]TPR53350.1 hypothetical protein FJR74_02720 [Metamycoplasma neophronis]